MRNLTARERAQAVIAQVRTERPNPHRMDDCAKVNDWYCVGIAVHGWICTHMPSLSDHFCKREIANPIIRLNDAGRFEDAWQRAEDVLCEYFTAETREREEEVT